MNVQPLLPLTGQWSQRAIVRLNHTVRLSRGAHTPRTLAAQWCVPPARIRHWARRPPRWFNWVGEKHHGRWYLEDYGREVAAVSRWLKGRQ